MVLPRRKPMSEDEFLAFDALQVEKQEFVGGQAHAMTGASIRHNRVSGNLFARLHAAVAGSPCLPLINDVKLRLDEGRIYYYPDVMLVCDPTDDDPLIRSRPCLIAEVASPSTATIDRREKWISYQRIQTLREYLILDQDEPRVEVYRRDGLRSWIIETLGPEDTLHIACLDGLAIPVAELYANLPPP
ncbi:MAG: Uma2 family endonuclease [Sulfurisoma sp.]|nr:Uma2 family endonuclease [Sulfurisoma sp.]